MAQIISIEKIRAEQTIRTVLKLMHEEFDKHTEVYSAPDTIQEAFRMISDAARTSQKYTSTQIEAQLSYLAEQFKIAQ